MKHKYVLYFLLALTLWPTLAQAQVLPIREVAVGDTLLLETGIFSIQGFDCPVVGATITCNNPNFFFRQQITSEGRRFWLFFAPKAPGVFHGHFYLEWFTDKSRCPLNNNATRDYYCRTPHDSLPILLKSPVYTTHLSVDTAREVIYGKIPLTLHNYSHKQITIDSIRCIGPNTASIALDSTTSSLPKNLSADTSEQTLNLYITSKNGPGLTVDAYTRIYGHTEDGKFNDTLLITFSSDAYCCPQANFIGPFTTNGIKFIADIGTTEDSSATIIYSKFVTGFTIDTLKYPFALTVEDKPFKKILHLHYQPLLHDTSESDLNIRYTIRYFNGDTVRFYSISNYNFMHLFLFWLALTNGVDQNENQNSMLKIFPTPAHDIVTISLDDKLGSYTLGLFNTSGNLIKAQSVPTFPCQLKVADLTPGIYQLVVLGKQRSFHQKIIVE